MNSQLVNALKFKMQPVAVILTNDKPATDFTLKREVWADVLLPCW